MKFLSKILVLSLSAFIVASVLPHRHLHAAENKEAASSDFYYQCSMHPWITSPKPGNCPICGMTLTKVSAGHSTAEHIAGRAAVQINPEYQQLVGVTKTEARVMPFIYQIHSVGHAAYNPDVATILAEYREAYSTYRKERGNFNERIREQAMSLMEIAEMKLQLAGLSSDQLEQIKKASFDTRILNTAFAPANLSLPAGSVWVDTDLYETDSELVKPDQKVKMTTPVLPGKVFDGVVRVANAVFNEYPRKVRARIESPSAASLKPGMSMDIVIDVDLGQKLAVPESALVDSGHSQIVFVETPEKTIEPRAVQVGYENEGYIEIVSGLHEGEQVISSATFLIDSESKLRAAAQGFSKAPAGHEGHGH